MKIRVRLILVIIPVLLILHLSTSLISGIFSTRVIEKQARESAQLLSHSFSTQLNSRLIQYLNISQDLGSSMITAIHIETTLKSIRKRYPQITNIFYAPAGDDVLEMTPYQAELVGYPISAFEAYQTALKTKTPTMSKAGAYFGKKSVVFFAPAISSFVSNQEPSVQGIVALVLPLDDIFWEISHLSDKSSGSIFVIDNQGNFLFHDNSELALTKDKQAISSHPIIDRTYAAMIDQQAGFVTYEDDNIKNYIAFSPIYNGHWSLGVYGTYSQITSAIDKISHINIVVTLIVIILGIILLYFVVRSVVLPIEQLTTFAQQIASGDKTVTCDIQTSSEIGILSTSINSMVHELRGHHEKLEKTVEERTTALQISNKDLHETIEKLDKANTTLQHTRDNLEVLVEERTEQLQKALNYIDNIIDSMPSILIGIDPNGAITQWNAEAENNTKLQAQDVLGKSLVEVIPRLEDIMDKIFNAIRNREKYLEPKRTRQDNNKTVYESITVYPLISNGIDGAVIRIDNITERVRIEESLHQSQKLDAIGQLAGGVAHDFNNMLSGILGAAQLLKTPERKLDEESLKYAELIVKSVTRAADLTAKLLAFGRKSEILFAPLDLHSIIDDAQAILGRTFDKKIQLTVEKQAEYSTVIGDSSALQSALMNIGINASHSMPNGGKIQLNTQNIHLDNSYCKASPFDILPGEYIDIEIRDTGQGIPQDHLRKIFEPFFTTKGKDKGTGLGLAAVYGTILDHHGAINVYSEENTGTVFHIYLPCSELAAITHRKSKDIIPGSGTILLVDDEEIIRITGKRLLKNMGYDVLTAENGAEGLEVFREQHARIDAIIMDMIMPEMDGHEAFLKMKEIDKSCKIIISSGFSKNESLIELRKAGLAGFIHKPFLDFELSHLLAEILIVTENH